MSQIASRARTGVSERVSSVRELVSGEVTLIKEFIGDVVERVNLNEQVEPNFAHKVNGGALGQKGNLPKSGIALLSGTADNLTTFVQKNAMLNRRLLSR